MEDCRRQFHEKQEQYDTDHAEQTEQLKEDIRHEREAREKLRPPSQTTSLGSSVTLFPLEAQSVESSSAEGSGGGVSPVQEEPPADMESEGGKEDVVQSEAEGEMQQHSDTVDSEGGQT